MRNRLRELRGEAGLSQGQLDEAMGVSRQTIHAIETERYTPSLPLAISLAISPLSRSLMQTLGGTYRRPAGHARRRLALGGVFLITQWIRRPPGA
jgi:putative transcriptional regulator